MFLKAAKLLCIIKNLQNFFVLKVFVVAEWKGFEPLRGYKPT